MGTCFRCSLGQGQKVAKVRGYRDGGLALRKRNREEFLGEYIGPLSPLPFFSIARSPRLPSPRFLVRVGIMQRLVAITHRSE